MQSLYFSFEFGFPNLGDFILKYLIFNVKWNLFYEDFIFKLVFMVVVKYGVLLLL